MEELKAKIIELERELELERQSKQLLGQGYDFLNDLYMKLGQDYIQLKKKYDDYEIEQKKIVDELKQQTLDAIEGYNSKVRRLNEMLKTITDEKVIEQISAIFAEENTNNKKNNY